MAEFPALPIFTDAFISDTTHLNAAQTGAYFMLLIIAWRRKNNALPDNDEILSKWARMDRRTWNKNKSIIMEFWELDNKQEWRQARLDDERKRAEQLRNKNAAAGRASALKRQGRHSTSVQPKSNETSTPSPSPSPTIKKERKKKFNPDDIVLPVWLPRSVWLDFVSHRKSIKKPLTERACNLSLKALGSFRESGHDVTKIIETTIINGWAGLFEPKNKYNNPNNNKKPTYSDDLQAAANMAIERLEGKMSDEIYE